ncbi:MAG: radical SAM protein [Hyphomicrobiaceae bacterium]|nr:radical SAM protein [Hyphomicrobiaceae bacterium]
MENKSTGLPLEHHIRQFGTAVDQSGDKPVFNFVLVKTASRCNIACTYCYWFRDNEVYNKPAVLTKESEDAFCRRLEEHITAHGLQDFMLVFHGGEPLLFPKYRFIAFQEKLDAIAERTGCEIERGVSTNAILIDAEWAEILKKYNVSVSVSIDGPPDIHDKYRIDFKGLGTHAGTVKGIEALRAVDHHPGIISVCNPSTDPEKLLAYVVDELGVDRFDILPPDATHADNPPPIDEYFIRLFDVWYEKYAARGVRITTLDSMIAGTMGGQSCSDTIGLGPIDTLTLMTDGTLEPLDVLRITGNASTKTDTSVHNHSLQDAQHDPRWLGAYNASLSLCDTCKACEYMDACGAGHLAQRWAPENGYDNPSVYCESWKKIFAHIWERLAPTMVLSLEEPGATLPQGDFEPMPIARIPWDAIRRKKSEAESGASS